MFTLSKISPELTIQKDSFTEIGSIIKKYGSRILLICSSNKKDKVAVNILKEHLKQHQITFIQCDLHKDFVNKDEIEKMLVRAKDFYVTSILSIGSIGNSMAGRYIAQTLSTYYIEIPTAIYTPFLLQPHSLFVNRIGDNFGTLEISHDTISRIILDPTLQREYDNVDLLLCALSILLDLSHIFLNSRNNIICQVEAKNLFDRLINNMKDGEINKRLLTNYGLTTGLYHGAASETVLDVTLYSHIAAYRFNKIPEVFNAILLPWFLEVNNQSKLAEQVHTILDGINFSSRLRDIGLTNNQLKEILSDNPLVTTILEKAI